MNILITGASKGIGRAITLKMASRGYNLALCARNLESLKALETEIKQLFPSVKIYIQAADCSLKEETISFAEKAMQEFGFIDVMINNAGIFKPSAILEEEDDSLQTQLNLNLLAPYHLYKKIGPLMRDAKKGYIINICSVASKEAIVDAGSYCVTKAALLSLNNIMRKELGEYGVKVTAILPGSTLTSSWEGTSISADKFIQPEDVAQVVDSVLNLSVGATIEEVTMKPISGQI